MKHKTLPQEHNGYVLMKAVRTDMNPDAWVWYGKNADGHRVCWLWNGDYIGFYWGRYGTESADAAWDERVRYYQK